MALFRLQTIIKKRINERSSNGAPIERNKEDRERNLNSVSKQLSLYYG